MKVLACQISVPEITQPEQRTAFLAEVADKITAALAAESVDMIVLPELSTIDYSRGAFDNLGNLAENLAGESFAVFAGLARRHRAHICYGIPRRDGGDYHITQVVIGADGAAIGHFDKLHVAQYGASPEKEYFAPGRHVLVFEAAGLRVAPIICYDIRIPELSRLLCVEHGVELILHCGAYTIDRSYYSWRPFVVTRALENQVFVLSLNRAGDEYGHSIFCPPWVDETQPEIVFPKAETLRVVEVDRARVAEARATYSFLADRHPDYVALEVRGGGTDPTGR